MHTMRAARFHAPGRIQLGEIPTPRPAPGEVAVAVSACGICGSDLHVMQGHVEVEPGRVLGHEFSGRVVESAVEDIAVGQRVAVMPLLPCGECNSCRERLPNLCRSRIDIGFTADGGFAERVLIPRAQRGVTVLPLPDQVSDVAGALVEPLAVGLRACGQAAGRPGRSVLVFGAGMIGQATIAFLSLSGAGPILAVDPSELRRRDAQARGAHATCAPDDLQEAVAIAGDAGFDAAIDCAGREETTAACLRHVRRGGAVVLTGIYGTSIRVPMDSVVLDELSVLGSFAYVGEFARVIELIADGKVDAESFVSAQLELADAPAAFALQASVEQVTKVLVSPR